MILTDTTIAKLFMISENDHFCITIFIFSEINVKIMMV